MSQTEIQRSVDSVVLTTLLGALLGALIWWPLFFRALDALSPAYQTWWVILPGHLVGGVFSLACALVALWLRYRPSGGIITGLSRIGVALLVSAAVATGAASTFALLAGFSSSATTVATEAAIVVTCCALGVSFGAMSWLRASVEFRKH